MLDPWFSGPTSTRNLSDTCQQHTAKVQVSPLQHRCLLQQLLTVRVRSCIESRTLLLPSSQLVFIGIASCIANHTLNPAAVAVGFRRSVSLSTRLVLGWGLKSGCLAAYGVDRIGDSGRNVELRYTRKAPRVSFALEKGTSKRRSSVGEWPKSLEM